MTGAPRFTLLSRDGCGLCDDMLEELETFCRGKSLEVRVVDVDADPRLKTRFGHKVPVLLLDGMPVCHGRLDPVELLRLLRPRE
jgi:glutaredoxin